MAEVARVRLVALLFACLPWFASCAVLPKLEAPKLSVVALKVQGGDFFSQRVQVRLRVFNPNSIELPISGIAYRIEINDTEIGNGSTASPFTVPAMGEAEFDVQVTANLASVLSQLLSKKGADTLNYRLRGEVSLSSGFLRHVPFDERGSVKLK